MVEIQHRTIKILNLDHHYQMYRQHQIQVHHHIIQMATLNQLMVSRDIQQNGITNK